MSIQMLVIVESPTKIKTVEKYLPHAVIASSVGHIRDLPSNEMGIDKDLKPYYVETKPEIIKRLVTQARGKHVILMTDDDREGESIAYHLHQVLGLKDNYTRAVTQSLTEKAIKRAIENGRKLDMNLVHAQECRRVADRLIGYRISPLVQNMLMLQSAGRVQSVALRLLVDRHRLIVSFNRKPYLELEAIHSFDGKGTWSSQLNTVPIIESRKFVEFLSPEDPTSENKDRRIVAEGFMQQLKKHIFSKRMLKVSEKSVTPSLSKAPAPLTTSTLLQRASNKLDWSSDKTMKIAQRLFELGVITYHRTDSTFIIPEYISEVRGFIDRWQQSKSLSGYLPSVPNTHPVSEHAQAGHEAIRPTDLKQDVRFNSPDESALYKLIFEQVIASQMSSAKFERTDVILDTGIATRGVPITFTSRGRIRIFDGWQAFSEHEEKNTVQELPTLDVGQSIEVINLELRRKHTKAPSRYTEAQIIKDLEKRGIGRPSTYASILATLRNRKYMKSADKFIDCTDSGIKLIDNIENRFQFVEYDYTADIEKQFDEVSRGRLTYDQVIHSINKQLDCEIVEFLKPFKEQNRLAACPKCSKQTLVKKLSQDKTKLYYQCISENCNSIFNDVDGKPVLKVPPSLTDQICPKCNKKHLFITEYKESTNQRYWFCSDNDCGFFTSSTQDSVMSSNPVPDLKNHTLNNKYSCPTPDCNTKLTRLFSQANNEHFWKCEKCSSSFNDQNEAPVFQNHTTSKVETEKCPNCSDGTLVLSTKKDWFFCSNNRVNKCKTFIKSKDGKPDFNSAENSEKPKVHSCPNCSKPLIYRPMQDKFFCSDYRNCKTVIYANSEGEPDLADLELRKKKLL